MMFYPNQPELNETVFIPHCKHPDCNDESPAFNNIETCDTWVRKHDDAHRGLDHKDDEHIEVEVYEYRKVRQLQDTWEGFK